MSMRKPSPEQARLAPDGSQPAAPSVLVVDDNEGIRIVLRMQLKLLGYRVLEAGSGQEALELGTREHPDLILIDVSMPQLDGLAATRLLRQDPLTRDIPVVALSAYHESDFYECALAAGCNDYASKPVEINSLADLVARNLRGPGAAGRGRRSQ